MGGRRSGVKGGVGHNSVMTASVCWLMTIDASQIIQSTCHVISCMQMPIRTDNGGGREDHAPRAMRKLRCHDVSSY